MPLSKKYISVDSFGLGAEQLKQSPTCRTERNARFIASVNGKTQRMVLETIAEERDEEERALAEELIVVTGAKIRMGPHTGEFRVLQEMPTAQGKGTGTTADKNIANFSFYDGFELTAVLGDWQQHGSACVQNNKVLIKRSTLQVMGKMPGNSPAEMGVIEIIDPGQENQPTLLGATEIAPVPGNEKLDFDVKLEHIKLDFTPLGVPGFLGHKENDRVRFRLIVSGKGVNKWHFKITCDGIIVCQLSSDIPVVTAPSVSNTAVGSIQNQDAEPKRLWPAGEYFISWNGFDTNNKYDSALFTRNKGFKATLVGQVGHMKKEAAAIIFTYAYKKVEWVDVKIDNNTRRIDVTLRVNLRDGGAIGLAPASDMQNNPAAEAAQQPYTWDKVPHNQLIRGQPTLKRRIRSFEDLEKLALAGINFHWGRNKNHLVGKDIRINNLPYEVYINAVNTELNAMEELRLIFNTNNRWLRSGNPGADTDDPTFAGGSSLLLRAVYFNVGYISKADSWKYRDGYVENLVFKETSAHEVGHEILTAYAGVFYSSVHKGTSEFKTGNISCSATAYPITGEIDIMQYYTNKIPEVLLFRSVAAEKDVLGLVWLSKLKSIYIV